MKKIKNILIALIIVIGIIFFGIPLLLKFAFGPINSTGEIQITNDLQLEYDETYMSDFAGEVCDVTFKNDNRVIGKYIFHNMNWREDVVIRTHLGKTYLIMPDSNMNKDVSLGYYVVSFNNEFENVTDSVYSDQSNFKPDFILN